MPNRLIKEQSLYLLQHAHNPVDWYPWSPEAFEKAAAENKPLIVSIGYAACHWCHVMERESFENEEVAAYMNAHFICIKVDREERPDVDHLYMDAVQAISGSGGWPLNVFVTPQRIPFYGGTYFPPTPAYSRVSWTQLLERMHIIWTEQHDEVIAQTAQMQDYLKQAGRISTQLSPLNATTCKAIADALLQQADKKKGGFGRAPKFPGSMAISFLLEHYHYTGNSEALTHALHSLEAMLNGGIYDQLGGGFARYSTDDDWLAPHFEKMLYDNALLILPLCDAWRITGKEHYKTAIQEVIAFADRELKHPAGPYYSALDADSEGVEGKFYTWTWEEWVADLGPDAALGAAYFGIEEGGNWEHTNIMHRPESAAAIAQEQGISMEELEERVGVIKARLLAVRDTRIRPQTDDKVLLSWNALMNLALTRAAIALDDDTLLHKATTHMEWLQHNMANADALLFHTWKDGTAKIDGHLDDYAFLIQALLQLGAASGDNHWIQRAATYAEVVVQQFSNEEGKLFYFSGAQQGDIPVRKTDVYDGATPSGNAVMAHNLRLLGLSMERTEWLQQSDTMLQQLAATASRYAYSFSYWGIILQRAVAGSKTVVAPKEEHSLLTKVFSPHVLCINATGFMLPVTEGKHSIGSSPIFVCTVQECLPPVATITEAMGLMGSSILIDG